MVYNCIRTCIYMLLLPFMLTNLFILTGQLSFDTAKIISWFECLTIKCNKTIKYHHKTYKKVWNPQQSAILTDSFTKEGNFAPKPPSTTIIFTQDYISRILEPGLGSMSWCNDNINSKNGSGILRCLMLFEFPSPCVNYSKLRIWFWHSSVMIVLKTK